MTAPTPEAVSRVVAHALRHEPGRYALELDDANWASVDALLEALHGRGPGWRRLQRDDLADMIASSSKQRYELEGDRVRALYGHSVPGRPARIAAEPPPVLFHGTSPRAWEVIRVQGLAPMRRQYVHLSVDVGTARQVGRRQAAQPVVIRVRAREAAEAGVRFHRGNELVWLADTVPPEVLEREN